MRLELPPSSLWWKEISTAVLRDAKGLAGSSRPAVSEMRLRLHTCVHVSGDGWRCRDVVIRGRLTPGNFR